ncbi:methionine-R-sulfoxide reductase B2, mitochondrial isoform X3 [Pogoniulus pusillus]|uniref:methionine-R-sulfoxide reductase B2, mitochondrial isoform X3 n=1 Tax=Pogoniulus pusillus TaxID=488313 RepID=UPI0030B958A0
MQVSAASRAAVAVPQCSGHSCALVTPVFGRELNPRWCDTQHGLPSGPAASCRPSPGVRAASVGAEAPRPGPPWQPWRSSPSARLSGSREAAAPSRGRPRQHRFPAPPQDGGRALRPGALRLPPPARPFPGATAKSWGAGVGKAGIKRCVAGLGHVSGHVQQKHG